jgi:hypothetical protein
MPSPPWQPLSAVAALWEMDKFDAEKLAEQLADRAFFRFNLEAGTLRMHDVVRQADTYLLREHLFATMTFRRNNAS